MGMTEIEPETRGIIVSNQASARARVQRELSAFAAIAPVGRYTTGSTSGGQIQWAIIRPASALTARQRAALYSAGFVYGRHGFGDRWQCGDSNLGWCQTRDAESELNRAKP